MTQKYSIKSRLVYVLCRQFGATDMHSAIGSLLAMLSQVICWCLIDNKAPSVTSSGSCCSGLHVSLPTANLGCTEIRVLLVSNVQGLPSVSGFCLGFGLGLRF